MDKEEWVGYQLDTYKDSDEQIVQFIADMLYMGRGDNFPENISELFSNGYCLYFAHILKIAFNRGVIFYVYDTGHIVWGDSRTVNGKEEFMYYDINGVYSPREHNVIDFIPIIMLGEDIKDFMHVPYITNSTTKEKVEQIYAKYKKYVEEDSKSLLYSMSKDAVGN